jgi:hypothetical protein
MGHLLSKVGRCRLFSGTGLASFYQLRYQVQQICIYEVSCLDSHILVCFIKDNIF